MKSIYSEIVNAQNARQNLVLVTLTEAKGSTPANKGVKMLVWENGKIFGSIGGGSLEKRVIEESIEVLKRDEKGISFEYKLVKDLGMCCGGTVTVFLDQIEIPIRLLIFGAGTIGKALAIFASSIPNFDITILDDRPEFTSGIWVEGVTAKCCDLVSFASQIEWDDHTFSIILTYSHSLDRAILASQINKPAGYIGMIGSRRKVAVTRKLFLDKGIADEDALNRVDMPMGINIAAKSPEEIAISILAGIIQVKNGNGFKEKKAKRFHSFFSEEENIKECTQI